MSNFGIDLDRLPSLPMKENDQIQSNRYSHNLVRYSDSEEVINYELKDNNHYSYGSFDSFSKNSRTLRKTLDLTTELYFEVNIIARENSSVHTIINIQNLNEYVIKKPIDLFTSQKKALDLLQNEASTNSKIEMRLRNIKEYPNYISLTRQFQVDYLLFEKGICDLQDFCNIFRKINKSMMLFFTNSIIQAVSILHSKEIIHNDIKMKNFVFFGQYTNNLQLKLIDFGNTLFGKFNEFQLNDIRKTIRLLSEILSKCDDIDKETSLWEEFLLNLTYNTEDISVKDIMRFYEIFGQKEKILEISQKLSDEFSEKLIEISMQAMISRTSHQDKLDLSHNLCLIGFFKDIDRALLQNSCLGNHFLANKEYKYYMKIMENQLILFVFRYFRDFREFRAKSLEITNNVNYENNNNNSIEELLIELNKIHSKVWDILNKEINSSNKKIYDRFIQFMKGLKILNNFFSHYLNGFNESKEVIKLGIEEIKDNLKEKVKKNKKHEKLYQNFWEFLMTFIVEKEGKIKYERDCMNSLKKMINDYMVPHNIKFVK